MSDSILAEGAGDGTVCLEEGLQTSAAQSASWLPMLAEVNTRGTAGSMGRLSRTQAHAA